VNGEDRQIHLGCFDTAEEAARAYARAHLREEEEEEEEEEDVTQTWRTQTW